MNDDRLVLVDANSLLHRAFHALPPLTSPSGAPTGAVYGFASMLLRVLTTLKPKYTVVVWDRAEPTFRHLSYANYKAQRPKTDELLVAQFEPARKIADTLGFAQADLAGFEADDVIGTLAKRYASKDLSVCIVTGDMDALQLVEEGKIWVYSIRRGFADTVLYDPAEVVKKYNGLSPGQLIDYKALAGDSADNIPGVPGVGEKTAIQLLNQYQNLDLVYQHLLELKPRQRELLEKGRESAYLSQKLATININVPIVLDLNDAMRTGYDKSLAEKEFLALGFKSILGRLPNDLSGAKNVNQQHTSPIEIVVGDENVTEKLLADIDVDWERLDNAWQESQKSALIVNILTGKTGKQLQLAELAQTYCGLVVDPENQLSASMRRKIAFAVEQKVLAELGKPENARVKKLFTEVDEPLQAVLQHMSQTGVCIDKERLLDLKNLNDRSVAKLITEIYKIIGYEFNLNSPKQLEEILFDQLKLPVKRKTKTQRSTDEATLKSLQKLHPVVEKLLQYRQQFKLASTYFDPLNQAIGPDGRVHTTYQQTSAASGRLSSEDPNLQNIPLGNEIGLRQVFIAPAGSSLLVADYSQIELRIMAHLTKDPNLMSAFTFGQDIHSATAARIFGKTIDDVTKEERRTGKTVNFALMYGMSAHGLSEALSIEMFAAKQYIEQYFANYPKVKIWQKELLEQAKRAGYVETMFGRRRLADDLKSPHFQVRAAAERAIINHPLQGTQADIVKMVMVKLAPQVNNLFSSQVHLIMQVHDELVFEVPNEIVTSVARLVKKEMEQIVKLNVALPVEVRVGKNWQDTERVEGIG